MTGLQTAWAQYRLRRYFSAHAQIMLHLVHAHEGDLDQAARAIGWGHSPGVRPFWDLAAPLDVTEIRYVFEDALRAAYRQRTRRKELVMRMSEVACDAVVFTREHGQCLLLRSISGTRECRVVGGGSLLAVAASHSFVVAPDRDWLACMATPLAPSGLDDAAVQEGPRHAPFDAAPERARARIGAS